MMGSYSKLWNFFYPKICLGCQTLLPHDLHLFCIDCLHDFQLTDPKEHCPLCFALYDDPLHPFCETCHEQVSPFTRTLATFLPTPIVYTLAAQLKNYPGKMYVPGIAALMAHHWLTCMRLKVDVVVFPPYSRAVELFLGPSSSKLLAKDVACLLGKPFVEDYAAVASKKVLLVCERLDKDLCSKLQVITEHHPQTLYGLAIY